MSFQSICDGSLQMAESRSVTTAPRHKRVLFLIGFLAYVLLMIGVAQLLDDLPIEPRPSPFVLSLLKWLFIAFSIITLAAPWLMARGTLPVPAKSHLLAAMVGREASTLVVGYCFLVCPIVFGIVLFILGMPIQDLYYFAAASAAAIFTWGVYSLRLS